MKKNTIDKKIMPFKTFLGSYISASEKLFVCLIGLVGLNIGEAYKIAFWTNAKISSCASMGGSLLKEKRIQWALWKLAQLHHERKLDFQDKYLREDTIV